MTKLYEPTHLPGTLLGKIPGNSGRYCCYGMFASHGGRSTGLFSSLNVGLHVGDIPHNVAENRLLVQKVLGIEILLSAKQVHGNEVFCLTDALQCDVEVDGYDSLITECRGVGLMIQHADCQAILLFDPVREVIGAIHCGWRGSVKEIIPHTIEMMAGRFGCRPHHIKAMISPSLGPCCAEFINYKTELPECFLPFMVNDNHFDFWRITKQQLVTAGIILENIRSAEQCTCCSKDYFSYRRATRLRTCQTGRNCSVIALPE